MSVNVTNKQRLQSYFGPEEYNGEVKTQIPLRDADVRLNQHMHACSLAQRWYHWSQPGHCAPTCLKVVRHNIQPVSCSCDRQLVHLFTCLPLYFF